MCISGYCITDNVDGDNDLDDVDNLGDVVNLDDVENDGGVQFRCKKLCLPHVVNYQE